jgi:hypothetical protein
MRSTRLLRALLALVLLAAPGGCRGATDPDPLVGTFLATTFQVTPSGQGMINVLTSGGTLGFNVANNFVVTGTLILPAAVTGGAPFTASMAGTAVRTGTSVQLTQSADTFVRNLTFTLVENRLEAVNQVVAGTTYNIILTRQ